MDFLETDFHKQKNPKRSIKLCNEDNLLLGLNLSKYPTFNNRVWKSILRAFQGDALASIKKGEYKSPIPFNLLDLIKIQTEKINQDCIEKLIGFFSAEAEKNALLFRDDFDQALFLSLDSSSKSIKNELVLPLIRNLDKPLENLRLSDEGSIFLMEEELTDVLTRLIQNKTAELLKFLISNEKIDANKEFKSVFALHDVKSNIVQFFENFKIGDLFAELYELGRNKSILDKQEFYLYFCDIVFRKVKYPLFYVPFNLTKETDSLQVDFDSQVYVNKKALEFIVQEYNHETEKRGTLNKISDRIIYLANHTNDFREVLDGILKEISHFFELDTAINLSNPDRQIAKSLLVSLSNACYICLFDKSDESLVNDYEDILGLLNLENSPLAEGFNNLIADFIHKEPKSFNLEVEGEWDSKGTTDKLVFESAIPLNGEQLQILAAINKEGCKYITVEGPPGTGKSHTITAIAFETILRNKSVLILSDKKEALDVVEDKITETLNKVRLDKNFQNPILRLGKTGSTYSQILAPASIENIKLHYRAVKKDYENIEQTIEKTANTVREELEAESLTCGEIDFKDIRNEEKLEEWFKSQPCLVNIQEMVDSPSSTEDLEEIRRIVADLGRKMSQKDFNDDVSSLLNLEANSFVGLDDFKSYLNNLDVLYGVADKAQSEFSSSLDSVLKFQTFTDSDFDKLNEILNEYGHLHSRIWGYLFKGKQLKSLDEKFKNEFPNSEYLVPHENLSELRASVKIFTHLRAQSKEPLKTQNPFDYLKTIHSLLKDTNVRSRFVEMRRLINDVEYLESTAQAFPDTFAKLAIRTADFRSLYENAISSMNDEDFKGLIEYIKLKQKITKKFNDLPASNYYTRNKEELETLVTTQMTHLLDGRVISFYEKNKATATALRNIIRTKQRFPKDEFIRLKEAFPCILAGIRDYAEYIPLEIGVFDLVIIDEASQVSIAQAFPALLRAKKVLILGDRKQFSNIKAAQARSDTNREYLNRIENIFREKVSDKPATLVRLKKFDIKTSILEFFEFISNYNTRLLKHFRGYKEIISYSNKSFYQDTLQVMKIRGKAIDEVLKFDVIKHDGKKELTPNSNKLEAEFIITQLMKLKDEKTPLSVGVITPHTNQQKLIAEMISKLPEADYFLDVLKLKIMTFDTCQGEERDIVFYSMVATAEDDRLWGVFIKDLASVDIEEEGKIKAQRLNVGFSRAKECMHFVLSKPIDGFKGAIGEALRHYSYAKSEAKKERSVQEVDSKSKMEPELLNWFYQTDFWEKRGVGHSVEIIPQFEIGKYLKQLDRTYNHPKYKVDFLVVYKGVDNLERKIIIEYDGFREHFKDEDFITASNYSDYYNDDDLYREKVLEGYGYRFLRVNKFNIGKNPIETLNKRLFDSVKERANVNELVENIHDTIEGMQNGQIRECPKCKELRMLEDFKDSSLITGQGRFCKKCKGQKLSEKPNPEPLVYSKNNCPGCNSPMLLRKGKYGKFYGCSRFPRCKRTRPYIHETAVE